MYAAVGIHPEDAQTKCKLSPDEEIARIKALVCDEAVRRENKIVAIGEIGFDYYWQPVNKELQREYFEKQMALADDLGLPVIIHDRDAHGDTFELLCRFPSVRGVLHSCSMSAEMVKEMVKRGWFISFSGTVTFKNANRVREACAAVPLDRILIETDAPYLAPVPHRGKMNNSTYMQNTALAVADVLSVSYDEIVRRTAENARELFGI
jgi:TatD DNase family protein